MAEPQGMTVVVTVEVEIKNREEWTTAFGVEGARDIRADVKRYVRGLVDGAGVFGNGEVRADVTLRNP